MTMCWHRYFVFSINRFSVHFYRLSIYCVLMWRLSLSDPLVIHDKLWGPAEMFVQTEND